MNSKYLGNSIDLAKLDMLTHLIKNSDGLGLFYVPMLTEPKPKERNPKYVTFELGTRNIIVKTDEKGVREGIFRYPNY